MSAPRSKPRLVVPSPIPGTTPAYARGIRLGAIRVRRDLADECHQRASIASELGDEGEYLRLHQIADRAERRIEELENER